MAVSVRGGAIELLDRRRVIIAAPGIRGARQPYHFAQKLELSAARDYLGACAAASERLARAALREVLQHLEARRYRLAGCGLLLASGRALPALPEILAAHPWMHAAEGEFFRNAIRRACEKIGIPVRGFKPRDLAAEAKSALGSAAPRIQRSIGAMGRSVGPPWTEDQKTAALAAAVVVGAG